ncbi:MAG: hypothetical protein HDT38_00545 [Clostridiales bacterium]|nr:hypothetical protein [Clostridiales bacterium]
MNVMIAELYTLICERISTTPNHQEKIHALAIAKMAVLNELEQLTEKDILPLFDVYTSLDGERQELREQMIFEAALEFGMELGRMAVKP